MIEQRYYQGISLIKETKSSEQANILLKQGYELLRITELSTTNIKTRKTSTSIAYVLGKRVDTQPLGQEMILQSVLPMIKWREKDDNFSWTFAKDGNGNIYSEFRAFVECLNASGQIEYDGYIYKLSGDGRFLHKIKVNKK